MVIVLGILLAVGAGFVKWRARRRFRKQSLVLPNTSLSLAMVLLMLCSAEFAFGLFYDQTDSFMLTNSCQRWILRHVQYNNLDCRDDETYSPFPPPDTFRILVVGDSFTFGYGIPDYRNRFTDLLKRRFEIESERKVQILNVGTCGAETNDELRFVEEILQNCQLDMILLVYTMNDASNLLKQTGEMYEAIDHRKSDSRWITQTYLLNFLYYRSVVTSLPTAGNYYTWVLSAYEEPTWSKHRNDLQQIVDLCQSTGIELRIVTFPLVASMDTDYALEPAHAKLAGFWDSNQVQHLDLLPIFRLYKAQDLVVNRFDGHPNEFAHKLASDAIWESLFANDRDLVSVPE